MEHTNDDHDPLQLEGTRFAVIPQWVLFHPTLTAVDVRVYGVIAALAGYSEIRPSRAYIADKVGMSVETVKRSIANLQDVGALVVIPRYGEKGRQSNGYRLVTDPPSGETKPQVRGFGSPMTRGVRVTHDPAPGSPMTHEEHRREENKQTQVPAQAPVSGFGADPDSPSPTEHERKRPPSAIVVDHFLREWQSTVAKRPEYGMIQRCPNKVAAYSWLNLHYFKPEHGQPVSAAHVVTLVDEFMSRVRTDQITPTAGFTAWQCFVKNVGRLGSGASEYTYADSGRVIVV
jgi:biotin operon repressor